MKIQITYANMHLHVYTSTYINKNYSTNVGMNGNSFCSTLIHKLQKFMQAYITHPL